MTAHFEQALTSLVVSDATLSRVMDRAVVLLAIAIGGLGLVVLLMGASETALLNAVATKALGEARHAAAWQVLGEPVQAGQASGVVVADDTQQRVEVVVPVRGANLRGKLYATAVVVNGEARLTSVRVTAGKDQLAIPLVRDEEGRRGR